jgi:hypothetical protein
MFCVFYIAENFFARWPFSEKTDEVPFEIRVKQMCWKLKDSFGSKRNSQDNFFKKFDTQLNRSR